MKTLHELCHTIGHTDQHFHGYTELFDVVLPPLNPKNILLLGVNLFGGGDVWAYSTRFPEATIDAVDLGFENIEPIIKNTCSNVKWIQGNVYTYDVFDQVKNTCFDVIVDDANHEHPYQYCAYKMYSSLLHDNGIYFIEDVGDEYWCNHLQRLIRDTQGDVPHDYQRKQSLLNNQIMLVIKKKTT